ncbi:MAG: exodeoxyribonuclease large subunit [Miltoncostaeaceae bacterium]|jgi:exodeoxyribonuclease VII large subunit|nr:exodeoxyribonuclease large subunit [Miltoncostaeaceae bacterium]
MTITSAPRPGPAPRRVYTVAVVTRRLGEILRERTAACWIEGEVTNLRHGRDRRLLYFTLKDAAEPEAAQLEVFARRAELASGPEPADGMLVQLFGWPELYEQGGRLQIRATRIEPSGEGAILARIEALRRRLDAEGLFAAARKRALPGFPRRVGLVTAADGAARDDVVTGMLARFPAADTVIVRATMQGPACADEVVRALRHLDRDPRVDVIVLARGGGSVQDLLPFSEEAIVRAIAACRTPTVSAIGHDRDVTLACLAADVRASTPTAAAALVVPDAASLSRDLRRLAERAQQAARRSTARATDRHGELSRRLGRSLEVGRARAAERLAGIARDLARAAVRAGAGADGAQAALRTRLARAGRGELDRAEAETAVLRARLAAADPTAPLERGFALVSAAGAGAVTSARAAAAARVLTLRFADGRVGATVTSAAEAP